MKKCPRCGVTKHRQHFSKNSSKASGLHSYCKACNRVRAAAIVKTGRHRKYRADYKARHPERYRADRILWFFRSRKDGLHGLTRDSIIAAMKQGLKCPYCREVLNYLNLSYDHKDGYGSSIHPVCVECNLLKNIVHHTDFLKFVKAIGPAKLEFYKLKVRRAWSRKGACAQ